MVTAEVIVVPLGTKTASLSVYVAKAIKVLQQERDVKYELTAMGTIMEGELDKVLTAAKKMHEATFGDGVVRVVTTIRIDDRRDKPLSTASKLESIGKYLGH
jgi:uncharacterized protein (TIGR00106 family)